MKAKCVRCGAEIENLNGRTKYCRPCYEKAHAEATRRCKVRSGVIKNSDWRKPRKCSVCGKEFVPSNYNKATCSAECKRISRNARQNGGRKVPAERTCEFCGKTFTGGIASKRFCSTICRIRNTNRRNAERSAILRKAEESDRAEAEKKWRISRETHGAKERDMHTETNTGTYEELVAQVKADMRLPASERYRASLRWTPMQRRLAQTIYNKFHRMSHVDGGCWECGYS